MPRGDNVNTVKHSNIIILGVDPANVEATLRQQGFGQALDGKLLISMVAGWSTERLTSILLSRGIFEQIARLQILRVSFPVLRLSFLNPSRLSKTPAIR